MADWKTLNKNAAESLAKAEAEAELAENRATALAVIALIYELRRVNAGLDEIHSKLSD